MKDPRSRIVSPEANSDIVSKVSGVYYIAADRVDEVVLLTPGDSDNVERMTMEMHWVLGGFSQLLSLERKDRKTYRYSRDIASRHGDFDHLVRGQLDVASL